MNAHVFAKIAMFIRHESYFDKIVEVMHRLIMGRVLKECPRAAKTFNDGKDIPDFDNNCFGKREGCIDHNYYNIGNIPHDRVVYLYRVPDECGEALIFDYNKWNHWVRFRFVACSWKTLLTDHDSILKLAWDIVSAITMTLRHEGDQYPEIETMELDLLSTLPEQFNFFYQPMITVADEVKFDQGWWTKEQKEHGVDVSDLFEVVKGLRVSGAWFNADFFEDKVMSIGAMRRLGELRAGFADELARLVDEGMIDSSKFIVPPKYQPENPYVFNWECDHYYFCDDDEIDEEE